MKSFVKENYSLLFLGIVILSIIIFGIAVKDNIRVTINDNLDSNIPIYKMIKDNHLFWEKNAPIPFLGGVVTRTDYKVENSISSWIYAIFSPLVSYYIIFILRVFFSSLGFFLLGKKMNDYGDFVFDKNIWGICGLIYGILGVWPHAALSFASLPWFALFVYILYKTGKKRYVFFSIIFVYLMSFALMGVFILLYLFIFIIILAFKDRKISFPLLFCFLFITFVYIIMNYNILFYNEGIKQISNGLYTLTFSESWIRFFKSFMGSTYYFHAGGATLKYTVIPFCFCFIFSCFLDLFQERKISKDSLFALILFLLIVFNNLICAFDYNFFIRTYLITFANGFSFWRIGWLTPFFWLCLFAIALEKMKKSFGFEILVLLLIIFSFDNDFISHLQFGTLKYRLIIFGIIGCIIENKKSYLKQILIILSFLAIILDPRYEQRNSMYNEIYWNNGISKKIDHNHAWRWKEFYSENLFKEIKESINYDGSWSIAFGLDPAVLQYNGIKTLDGYYPNYSKEYHDIFEKLIKPLLKIDNKHASYWRQTGGTRAYVYSIMYDFTAPKKINSNIETNLYIDPFIFKEMKGKYVFSRFKIINWDKLGLVPIGRNYSSKYSPYNILVYKLVK